MVIYFIKNLPAVQGPQEMRVRSLGQRDTLEEGMTTHSSILAWRNLMDGEAWWAIVHGVAKSQTQLEQLSTQHTHTHKCVYELFISAQFSGIKCIYTVVQPSPPSISRTVLIL